jgi:hypothetical protein
LFLLNDYMRVTLLKLSYKASSCSSAWLQRLLIRRLLLVFSQHNSVTELPPRFFFHHHHHLLLLLLRILLRLVRSLDLPLTSAQHPPRKRKQTISKNITA